MAGEFTKQFSRTTGGFKVPPSQLVIIGHDTDHKEGEHPQWRKIVKPTEEQIASYKGHGIQKKVWVSREKLDGQECFVVIDGRTRTIGAREAGIEFVEVEMKTGSEAQLYGLAWLANLGGKTEKAGDVAKAAQRLLDMNQTKKEIAGFLQIDLPMLEVYLSVQKLAPKIVKAIDTDISLTAASKLANLDQEAQIAEFEKMIEKGDTSVRAASAVRASKKAGAKREVSPAPKRRIIARLLERVVDKEEIEVEGASEDFWLGVKFSQGLMSPSKIKGLTKAIDSVTPKKRAPKVEAADASAE